MCLCVRVCVCPQDLGYTGAIGYEAFLYPNEKDMRTLLSWFIEKLPRDHKDDDVEEILGIDIHTHTGTHTHTCIHTYIHTRARSSLRCVYVVYMVYRSIMDLISIYLCNT